MNLRIYVAGPMTGLPDFNYPAFNAEAERLRAIGYRVENPANNPKQATWQEYMREAVAQLAKCDMVVVLPGWENSRGALIENGLAVSLGIPVKKSADIQVMHPNPNCWGCDGKPLSDEVCAVCMWSPVDMLP